jgi:Magnesium chelatase, subunit ChlI
MVGPPGAGKSMLAARLPGILPPLEPAEALELGMIQSVAGGLRSGELSRCASSCGPLFGVPSVFWRPARRYACPCRRGRYLADWPDRDWTASARRQKTPSADGPSLYPGAPVSPQ